MRTYGFRGKASAARHLGWGWGVLLSNDVSRLTESSLAIMISGVGLGGKILGR